MAYFGKGGIQTSLTDPHLNKSQRIVEFRLDKLDAMYLSNLRIANLGYYGDASGNLQFANGVGRIIDRISLLDGQTQISQQTHFSRWNTFTSLRTSNENNRNVQHQLTGSGLGFEVKHLYDGVTYCAEVGQSNAQKKHESSDSNTFHAWFDVKAALPFLQVAPVLSTNVFKNLRLVIEYKQSVFASSDTTLQPILIADEMVDEKVKASLMRSMKQMDFIENEHDSFVMDAVQDLSANKLTIDQTLIKQVRGFNNKLVNRMVIMNEPMELEDSEKDTTLLFNDGSQLLFRQKNNVRLNGRTLLQADGIDTPAKSTSYATDVWGTMNVVANKNFVHNSNVAPKNSLYSSNLKKVLDKFDYRAFRINERVETLEVVVGRTGCYDAQKHADGKTQSKLPVNAKLLVHVFGECVKRININSDGSYLIGYA